MLCMEKLTPNHEETHLLSLQRLDPDRASSQDITNAVYTWLTQRQSNHKLPANTGHVAATITEQATGGIQGQGDYLYEMANRLYHEFSRAKGTESEHSEADLEAFLSAPLAAQDTLDTLVSTFPAEYKIRVQLTELLSSPHLIELCAGILIRLQSLGRQSTKKHQTQPLLGLLARDMIDANLLPAIDPEKIVPTPAELDRAQHILDHLLGLTATSAETHADAQPLPFPSWDKSRHDLSGNLRTSEVHSNIISPFVTMLEQLHYVLALTQVRQDEYDELATTTEDWDWDRLSRLHQQAQELLDRIKAEFPFQVDAEGKLTMPNVVA